MIPQAEIDRYAQDSEGSFRLGEIPTLWYRGEEVIGPFLLRANPNRLLMLSDQATRAIFCQLARKQGVNMDSATRGLSGQVLTQDMGNSYFTN